jgi:hypothetical protein
MSFDRGFPRAEEETRSVHDLLEWDHPFNLQRNDRRDRNSGVYGDGRE